MGEGTGGGSGRRCEGVVSSQLFLPNINIDTQPPATETPLTGRGLGARLEEVSWCVPPGSVGHILRHHLAS